MALEAAVRLRRRPDARRAIILGADPRRRRGWSTRKSAILALILRRAGAASLGWRGGPSAERLKPAAPGQPGRRCRSQARSSSPWPSRCWPEAAFGAARCAWRIGTSLTGPGLTTLFAPSPRVASAGADQRGRPLPLWASRRSRTDLRAWVLTALAVLGGGARLATHQHPAGWHCSGACGSGAGRSAPGSSSANRTYIPP